MAYTQIAPEITVLLLGDAEVGKSTFLSYVALPAVAYLSVYARTIHLVPPWLCYPYVGLKFIPNQSPAVSV
jgi:GTPase SAR1 family protein